ncbi:MAG: hypothetical protein JO101_02760, partial [Candidatus Eremiobacteraeota bacterium]|nr:hypothetical protein [Candidatus Eremiobacteraeota bacterium]
MSRSISSLALAAALALGGCATGGNQNAPPNPFPLGNAPATTGSAVLTTMAGVGDSLTAGEQSSGLVGQNAANPFFPATSALPFLPATQTSGFWALLWSAAHGGASAANVLPLIKSPGIGTYMIPLTNGSFTALQSNCSGLNASAFDPVGATTTRVSTSLPFDLGVPGQTVHEALYAIAPVGSCAILSVAPFSLFQSENQNIYPILSANFPGLSQVRAAASLHPTLTTVWLGANDLLKYLFSAG